MVGPDGKLGFFIIDEFVYTSAFEEIGQIMFNTHLPNHGVVPAKGYSEIAIVPDPMDCNRFYIFTSASYSQDYLPGFAVLEYNQMPLF
mgnify:FL=1